jgi:CHAD domain-containing protein
MALVSHRGKVILRRMERNLVRLAEDPNREAVHDFRTTSRRLETLLDLLFPVRDRNQRKLLKLLSRIRRRAGRIRDIDVQLAALRSFKVPQEPRRKTQLIHRLIDFRVQHEQKLAKLLKNKAVIEVNKRIRRASQSLPGTSNRDPLVVANEILRSVSTAGPLNDEILHRYRIAVKRARYAAELAPRSSESDRFIAGLKQLQDALGSWHDWMTLTRTASQQLGEIEQSSLVAALHNVTRVKFRHAVAALSGSPAHSVAVNPVAQTREPAKRPAASQSQAA